MHSVSIGLKYTSDQSQIEPYSTSFEINYILKKMHSEHIQVLWQNINADKSVFCSRLSFIKCLMQQSDHLNSLLLKQIWSQTTQTTGVLDMQEGQNSRWDHCVHIYIHRMHNTFFFFHFVLQRQEETVQVQQGPALSAIDEHGQQQ